MQSITVCSLDVIYLYSSNTQIVLSPQDTLKVLPDPGTRLKDQILCFKSGQNFLPPI